jgi:hypothetical protein
VFWTRLNLALEEMETRAIAMGRLICFRSAKSSYEVTWSCPAFRLREVFGFAHIESLQNTLFKNNSLDCIRF